MALLLFAFLSVSFSNVAEARDLPSQEKILYLTDYACLADSSSEYDSDDHSFEFTHEVTADFDLALATFVVQTQSSNYLHFSHLRPLTRAPPKAFI